MSRHASRVALCIRGEAVDEFENRIAVESHQCVFSTEIANRLKSIYLSFYRYQRKGPRNDIFTNTQQLDRFLSTVEVLEITGWSRATLWRQWRANRFPRPIRTSPQRVGFLESEVAEWQANLIATRNDPHTRRKPGPKPKRAPRAKRLFLSEESAVH